MVAEPKTDMDLIRARIHYHRRKGNINTLVACRAKLEKFDVEFHEDTVIGAVRVRVCGLDLFYSLRESAELYGYAQAGAVGGQWQGVTSWRWQK